MPRYGSFHIMTSCGSCGLPVPVNGPLTRIECAHCFAPRDVVPDTFADIMNALEEEYHSFEEGDGRGVKSMGSNGTFSYTILRRQPQCAQCKSILDVSNIVVGSSATSTCPECHTEFRSFPVPDWLRAIVPSAVQCYNADGESSSDPGEVPAIDQSIPTAIAMSCPSCGAGLKVTGDWQRTHPCEYCHIEVFIPDALWKRLHPVKTARHWGVRFEGKGVAELALVEKQEAAAEQIALLDSAPMPTDAKSQCIRHVEVAIASGYDEPHVERALGSIESILRPRLQGELLFVHVRKLVEAENGPRAIRLLEASGSLMPISTVTTIAIVAIGIAGLVVGLLFLP